MKVLIDQALLKLYPNTKWILRGEDYSGLEWLDDSIQKPSREELEATVTILQKEWDDLEYQRLRVTKYPPLADLADALFWQQQGDNSKMESYLEKVSAVKTQYPKP